MSFICSLEAHLSRKSNKCYHSLRHYFDYITYYTSRSCQEGRKWYNRTKIAGINFIRSKIINQTKNIMFLFMFSFFYKRIVLWVFFQQKRKKAKTWQTSWECSFPIPIWNFKGGHLNVASTSKRQRRWFSKKSSKTQLLVEKSVVLWHLAYLCSRNRGVHK